MNQSEHSPTDIVGGVRDARRAAYTVNEFCDAHRISRSKLYQLWAAGLGPRFIRIGSKKIITTEAAANWRRAGEANDKPSPTARRRGKVELTSFPLKKTGARTHE
jgi:hypothetical protein